MPTLDWLNREAAFRSAEQVPTRVLFKLNRGMGVSQQIDAALA